MDADLITESLERVAERCADPTPLVYERLFAQNAIAREEYEQLTSAQTEAQADVASIHAQLGTARLNLDFTHVRSPIDGRVSRAIITPGNLVSSTDVLTNVVSDDPIYAYFDTD